MNTKYITEHEVSEIKSFFEGKLEVVFLPSKTNPWCGNINSAFAPENDSIGVKVIGSDALLIAFSGSKLIERINSHFSESLMPL